MKKLQNNRPLLYLDFLGFSDTILSKTMAESVEYYKALLDNLKSLADNQNYLINFDIVSDSAFLWVEGKDIFNSTLKLFKIATTILHNSLFNQTPVRGSIVFDDFIIGDKRFKINNKSITSHVILGKAIINGYKWEQIQNWFGISINPVYLEIFETKLPGIIQNLLDSKNIIYYDIPTKLGTIKSYAVCAFYKSHIVGKYTFHWKKGDKTIDVPTYPSMLKELKSTVKDFSILNKLTNTETFLEYITQKKMYFESD
jgi:hypothetical protein